MASPLNVVVRPTAGRRQTPTRLARTGTHPAAMKGGPTSLNARVRDQ